jgi:hypothetical protein
VKNASRSAARLKLNIAGKQAVETAANAARAAKLFITTKALLLS